MVDTLSGDDEVDEVTNIIPEDNLANEAMDIDYTPVKVIVVNGIVMRPTVSIIIYLYTYYTQFLLYSIVHMIIVFLNLPILVMDHSVNFIKTK